MSEFGHIHFDMSRQGLVELSALLEPQFETLSPELQNFTNEIRGMCERAPEIKEPSWLDE